MGMTSKRKGGAGEREAAKEVSRLFHVDARRGRQYSGSQESPDIVVNIPGIHWEVKRCEALRLYDAVSQAETESAGSSPIVLHRKNGKPWLAVIPLESLPDVVAKLYLAMAGGR